MFALQKHMDAYFARIADIIKKGKIPVRIKFMLQDVQEMRDNGWVPRVRQDKQLKTIDQVSICDRDRGGGVTQGWGLWGCDRVEYTCALN